VNLLRGFDHFFDLLGPEVTAVEEATGEILEAGEEQATPGVKVWWSVAGRVAVLGGGQAG